MYSCEEFPFLLKDKLYEGASGFFVFCWFLFYLCLVFYIYLYGNELCLVYNDKENKEMHFCKTKHLDIVLLLIKDFSLRINKYLCP